MLLSQNPRHILICGARMDDQRQAGFARGGDMVAQRGLLDLGAFRRVMIIKAGLADPDEFRMARERDQLVRTHQGLVGGRHRMGARGEKHA